MKIKVTQKWPITYQMVQYATGDEFEADDATARELIAAERAVEVKGLKTADNGGTTESAPLSPEERDAKIRNAVKQLLAAKPDDKPKCPDIAELTGIKDVSAAERDAVWAELKGN